MDPLEEALIRAVEYGGAPPQVWHIPENAEIHLPSRIGGHPFAGMVATFWPEAGNE